VDGLAITHLDAAAYARLLYCNRYLADGELIDRLPVRQGTKLLPTDELPPLKWDITLKKNVSASISASAIVAHLCFVIPRASCICVISRILCVLQCGRSRPAFPAMAIIASRLASSSSR